MRYDPTAALNAALRAERGRFFSVVFRKKDGTLRKMVARTGVAKGVKGVGMRYDPRAFDLLPVWDVQKGDYRMVNLRTVEMVRLHGREYRITAA